jgi:membrane-associated protease RseP (regulator of RpoE activity)
VDSVTIGFGREFWSRRDRRGTRWSVRLLPICGFVRFEPQDGALADGDFRRQPVWKRLAIVAAGPAGNLLTAFMVLAFFFSIAGVPSTPPLVTGVEIGSPAMAAGFKPGDYITAFRGQPLRRFEDMQRVIEAQAGAPLAVTFLRDGKLIDTQVTPVRVAYDDTQGVPQAHGRIGLMVQHIPMMLSAVTAVNDVPTNGDAARTRDLLRAAMDRTVTVGLKSMDRKVHVDIVRPMGALNRGLADPASDDYDRVYFDSLTGNEYLDLGVGGALRETGHAVGRLIRGLVFVTGRPGTWDKGLIAPETPMMRVPLTVKFLSYDFAHLTAALSLCIALLNLLPLPGLDGGFLLGLILEGVVGPARARTLRRPVLHAAFICVLVAWLVANVVLKVS